MQKSVVFLYTNNKLWESKIKKTIPFTIASKRIKYLGINFTEWVKDLYTESYNWWEKLKTTHKWKDILCSWTGIINIVKMRRLLKATCRFKAMPIKIPKAFFFFSRKRIQTCMEPQKSLNSQNPSWGRTELESSHFLISSYITGVLIVAQWLTNPTRNHEVTGLAQWVKDPLLLWAVV